MNQTYAIGTDKPINLVLPKKAEFQESALNEKVNNKTKVTFKIAGINALGVTGEIIGKKIPFLKQGIMSNKLIREAISVKSDTEKILLEHDIIQAEAAQVLSEAKTVVDDVTNKIRNTLATDPSRIKEEGGNKIYEEFVDGILARKSIFLENLDDIFIDTIETYKSGGTKDVITQSNRMACITQDLKETTSDSYEYSKDYIFKTDGTLLKKTQGLKQRANNEYTISENVLFDNNGMIREISKGIERTKEMAMENCEKIFQFNQKGMLKEIITN